jgi:uncharacterized membrane protein YgdD (TMEM256/DUF423 family)
MPTAPRTFLIIGCLSLLAATQLSALGFHALDAVLTAPQKAAWQWANQLQFFHSLGLVLLALLAAPLNNSRLLTAASILMLAGIFLFSGSIYVNSLGLLPVGQLAPLGGGAFMLAWLLVAIAAWRVRA